MKIKESIVVEGRHDEARLKEIVDAHIVITSGENMSQQTLKQLKELNELHGIIIFSDPDNPGKRLRQKILNEIPNAKQAFLAQSVARHKRKVGIEHASKEAILEALQHVVEPNLDKSDITMNDLMEHQLIYHPDAAQKRQILAHKYHMSEGNAKQFLKQCHLFGIQKKDL